MRITAENPPSGHFYSITVDGVPVRKASIVEADEENGFVREIRHDYKGRMICHKNGQVVLFTRRGAVRIIPLAARPTS